MKTVLLCSKQLGVDCLKALLKLESCDLAAVLTVKEKADTRSHYDSIEAICGRTNTPLYSISGEKETEAILQQYSPDICMVACWYRLLNQKILDAVPEIIGIHHSLLPKYRGGSPLVWQIINGEPVVGSSLFSIGEGVDAGKIWGQYKLVLDPNDYVKDVEKKLNNGILTVFKEKWPRIISGDYNPRPQTGTPSYCAQRIPKDGKIDWQWTASEIYNFIRAQSDPYPGAFTMFKGEKLHFWKATVDEYKYYGTPGQVARIKNGKAYLICGDNKAVVVDAGPLNSIKIRL